MADLCDSVTALDYLESQLELEKEAREIMPFEPDTCTYPKVLRQLVFACLTCLEHNNGNEIGVCYLCLIQCHSTHELVELFSKRNFVCDCGTTRMGNGLACSLRYGKLDTSVPRVSRMRTGSGLQPESFHFPKVDLPKAEDIPSLENLYNQNYKGLFCSCSTKYDPDDESRTMHQCYFGEVCGEDWYHQDCILGFRVDKNEDKDDNSEQTVPHFPELDLFSEFICWKCVAMYSSEFKELAKRIDIVSHTRPHYHGMSSADQWFHKWKNVPEESAAKRIRLEEGKSSERHHEQSSLFLAGNFKSHLNDMYNSLPQDSSLRKLLHANAFLYEEDPVYEPEEDSSEATDVGTLFELGSSALLSLPAPHALEGLQAYDTMKQKLSNFFKGFVDQNKVVTEKEVKEFFGKMKKDN
ncbi:hypothetical protein PUMCH_001909 [Australozyma saopauloensis]|uniref:UBR-type domain-containing protein n=1 Tax=Australozyma saopauloensis TaxID=291208 RepID=A0AAX4H896_9ASCO|nr:hypothetical protein PUMCH_001909 [[Candida] saopauloensis]